MTDDSDTIPNPERGCGHLERGKAYIRGVSGSGDGILPGFVEVEPHIPYREIGTDGSFTRSYERIDGFTIQAATEGAQRDYNPLINRGDYMDAVGEKMVDTMHYATPMEIPELEIERHFDRIRNRAVLDPDTEPSIGFGDWGRMDVTGQTDLLMRAGKTHYPEPEDFIRECVEHGLSKAIPVSQRQEPPTIVPGITRCWILHPEADDEQFGGAVIGYVYLNNVVFTLPEDGQTPAYIDEMEDQGQINVVDIEPPQDAGAQNGNMTLEESINGDDNNE